MLFFLLEFVLHNEPPDPPVFDQYVEWSTSLTGLQYERGKTLNGNSKKVDCSWLPIAFWETLGLWDRVEKKQDTNSYKLFLMGKKRDSYFDIRRGDSIFFLPFTWSDYHIAFAMTGVVDGQLEIIDFMDKHYGRVKVRKIRLSECGWSYCYANKRRILSRTNVFEELLSNK